MTRPADTDYAPFYETYVSLVTEADAMPVLERQADELRALAGPIDSSRETFRYAPGKWSIREVIGHLCDAERVFGYRAFCFSRGEAAPLPAFDENSYIEASGYDERALADLVDDFRAARGANLTVLRSLDPGAWERVGTANNNPVSVRALAFIMAGHVRHHFGVLRSRYGVA